MPSPRAGYSGTPLRKKLGLRPEHRCCLINEPAQFREMLDDVDELDLRTQLRGAFDYVHVFVDAQADLERLFPRAAAHVSGGGMLWVSWPKKSSKLARDLTEDGVRSVGLRTEFVDVKVCAIDSDWSGLKFLRRRPNAGG